MWPEVKAIGYRQKRRLDQFLKDGLTFSLTGICMKNTKAKLSRDIIKGI